MSRRDGCQDNTRYFIRRCPEWLTRSPHGSWSITRVAVRVPGGFLLWCSGFCLAGKASLSRPGAVGGRRRRPVSGCRQCPGIGRFLCPWESSWRGRSSIAFHALLSDHATTTLGL